jgi:putative ABC transport system permease protein
MGGAAVIMLKMAFRNVGRQRRRTILTGLTIFGGFTLAVIFIGWADGSYNNIIDEFTRNRLGHIQIHERTYLDRPSLYKTINDLPAVGGILDGTKGVESWAPRVYAAALAAVGEKSMGVQIVGIDPGREGKTTHFERKIVQGREMGRPGGREAVIGRGLADILKAGPGTELVLVTQAADGSIAENLFTVTGLASSGDDLADRATVYLNLSDAQYFLVLPGRVHEVAVTVNKLARVPAIARDISQRLKDPKLAVEPWQVFARAFYEAMMADKAGMWVMLVVIVIIVAVGVLNTVLMSVLERRREYGLLKAVGTRPGQVIRLVLLEVLLLALAAVIIGSGVGFGANSFLASHGIKFSEDLTYGGMKFGTMRGEINLRSFLIPLITVIVTALLVSLVPALRAGRTDPAESMRQH